MEEKEWDETEEEPRCTNCGGHHGPTLVEMAYGELRYHERTQVRREKPDDSYLLDPSGVF